MCHLVTTHQDHHCFISYMHFQHLACMAQEACTLAEVAMDSAICSEIDTGDKITHMR
jgi:hypothetical protein